MSYTLQRVEGITSAKAKVKVRIVNEPAFDVEDEDDGTLHFVHRADALTQILRIDAQQAYASNGNPVVGESVVKLMPYHSGLANTPKQSLTWELDNDLSVEGTLATTGPHTVTGYAGGCVTMREKWEPSYTGTYIVKHRFKAQVNVNTNHVFSPFDLTFWITAKMGIDNYCKIEWDTAIGPPQGPGGWKVSGYYRDEYQKMQTYSAEHEGYSLPTQDLTFHEQRSSGEWFQPELRFARHLDWFTPHVLHPNNLGRDNKLNSVAGTFGMTGLDPDVDERVTGFADLQVVDVTEV